MSSRRHPGQGAVTVRARVLLMVVIPLALLYLVVGEAALSRRRDAVQAREVEGRVAVLDRLVDLRTGLFAERLGSVAAARAGSDDEAARLYTSLPQTTGEVPAARQVDVALAALDPASRPFGPDALVRLRRVVENGVATTARLAAGYDDLGALVARQLRTELARVSASSVELRDNDLVASVAGLGRTIDAYLLAGGLVTDLTDFWFAEPFEATAARTRLAGTLQAFRSVDADLEASPVPQLAPAWVTARAVDAGFDREVDQALLGVDSPFVTGVTPQPRLSQIMADGYRRAGEVGRLPALVSRGTQRAAAALDERSESAATQAAILAVGAVTLSMAAALFFGRSIVRPVIRLTDRCRRLAQGNLTGDPLPATGPPELVLASRAFNDLVANLGIVERKAQALAELRLDDPVLSAPLAGRLGQSLERSVGVLSDSVREREDLQARLVHEAAHDALTGLANRHAARRSLATVVYRGRRGNLVSVDLNGFKKVNDRYGHAVGDRVLHDVAERLTAQARNTDLVARLDGDEFLVLSLTGDDDAPDPGDGVAAAHRIVTALAEPFTVDRHRVLLTASAGVVPLTGGTGPEELLRRVEFTMRRAKRPGGGPVEQYDEAVRREVAARIEVEEALAADLAAGGGGLRLVYQPIVDAVTRRAVSVEALVRWDRPGIGTVPPDAFIPVAEASGLIVELDRWVLRNAASELASWASEPALPGLSLAVNVSGRHIIDDRFPGHVRDAIAGYGFAPGRFVVEVTETALVTDFDHAAEHLRAVRELGVRVALDDFGTGYTSIAQLRMLPIDELKVDKSVIDHVDTAQGRKLVGIVIDLARYLGVVTVAEGVETPRQADLLAALGCTTLQGYHFSRPLAPDALRAWAAQPAVGLPTH